VKPFTSRVTAFLAAGLLAVSLPNFAHTESLSGSYLAATQANFNNDHLAASKYYADALARDPQNPGLMQRLLFAYLAIGEVKKGVAVARRLDGAVGDSQLAKLVLMTDDIERGDFDAAIEYFGDDAIFSPLLGGLAKSWILLGRGQMSDAIAEFDTVSENDAMRVFSTYHKALALALAGDFVGADALLSADGERANRISRSSIIAHVQIMAQLDKRDEALALIDDVMNGSADEELLMLREKIAAGDAVAFDHIQNPADGIAEMYFTLASVLVGDRNDRFGLVYVRLAEFLRPHSIETLLLAAEMLEDQGQHALAVKSYDKVPPGHPLFYSAEIGRADALFADNKSEAAIEVLRELTKTHPDNSSVFTSLGDALRRMSLFSEASEAYNSAIALMGDPAPNQWFVYYARGVSFERDGQWDKAEADFRFSLELSPNQPLVLNYLGYGLVEKRLQLDEAQKMIENAVSQRPADGYITDSLGWVLYRLNKFDEAVPHVERAVELLPVDPIINDHLGDVYWMVGRKLEAEFQWRRALSFEPDLEADVDRIRLKLEIGLDEVLKSEKITVSE